MECQVPQQTKVKLVFKIAVTPFVSPKNDTKPCAAFPLHLIIAILVGWLSAATQQDELAQPAWPWRRNIKSIIATVSLHSCSVLHCHAGGVLGALRMLSVKQSLKLGIQHVTTVRWKLCLSRHFKKEPLSTWVSISWAMEQKALLWIRSPYCTFMLRTFLFSHKATTYIHHSGCI